MLCRLCDKETVELEIDFGMQPIVHQLNSQKIDNEKYPMRLGKCTECDFLQLMDCISPDVLYKNYFTLSGWKNQPHTTRMIDVLESITGINKDSTIFEIGCNDGSFLGRLKKLGYLNISGIEPTSDAYQKTVASNLNVKHDFFREELVKKEFTKNSFDVVITRQVLEHIIEIKDFIKAVGYILKDKGTFVIEVPDTNYNLEMLDYALWEEHVNYFTLNTLNKLLLSHGFRIIHTETTLFSGRAISIFCEKSKKTKMIENKNYAQNIDYYTKSWTTFNEELEKFLKKMNKPIAIYGCGARSSTFVNFTNISKDIDVFIDYQEEKQNHFLPGSNIPIVSWNDKYSDYIILLGVNTENEFKVINKRGLDLKNTFSILPPSSLIPEFWKNMYNDSL